MQKIEVEILFEILSFASMEIIQFIINDVNSEFEVECDELGFYDEYYFRAKCSTYFKVDRELKSKVIYYLNNISYDEFIGFIIDK